MEDVCVFFFFKQKTAYEMRISDWSSDVCSSDLVTLSFNLASGVSLGKAVEVIEAVEQEIGLPAGIQTRFQGAAEAFRASLSSTLLLILAAVVTMYIVRSEVRSVGKEFVSTCSSRWSPYH